MVDRILALYTAGELTNRGLTNLTTKKFMTPEEYKQITGEEYVAPNPYGITDELLTEIQDDTANEITQEVAANE